MIDVWGAVVGFPKKEAKTNDYPYKKLKAMYEKSAHLYCIYNYIHKANYKLYEGNNTTKAVKNPTCFTD